MCGFPGCGHPYGPPVTQTPSTLQLWHPMAPGSLDGLCTQVGEDGRDGGTQCSVFLWADGGSSSFHCLDLLMQWHPNVREGRRVTHPESRRKEKVVWQTNKGLPPMTWLNVIKMSFLLKNPCIPSTSLANLIGFIMETDGLILQFVWTVSVWEWPVPFWKDTLRACCGCEFALLDGTQS